MGDSNRGWSEKLHGIIRIQTNEMANDNAHILNVRFQHFFENAKRVSALINQCSLLQLGEVN